MCRCFVASCVVGGLLALAGLASASEDIPELNELSQIQIQRAWSASKSGPVLVRAFLKGKAVKLRYDGPEARLRITAAKRRPFWHWHDGHELSRQEVTLLVQALERQAQAPGAHPGLSALLRELRQQLLRGQSARAGHFRVVRRLASCAGGLSRP